MNARVVVDVAGMLAKLKAREVLAGALTADLMAQANGVGSIGCSAINHSLNATFDPVPGPAILTLLMTVPSL